MESKSSPFISFKFKGFFLLWLGLFISNIGSQMQLMAINWHIYLLTGSAISLGLIGLFRFLPLVVFSPVSGIVADLYDRKKIILFSQTIMTISALIFALTTFFHIISPLLIYSLISLNAIAYAFDSPARQSLYPLMVPKKYFTNATSLINLMWKISSVVGPTIGGLIIAGFNNLSLIYFLNAISFLAIIIALFFIKPEKQVISKEISFNFKTLKEGVGFVFKSPLISSTMLLDFFATFFASANVLLPIFAKEILKVGPQGFGLLYSAQSVGGILAGLIFSVFHRLKNQGKILIIAVLVYGLSTILFGFSKSFYWSFIFLAVAGFCDVISSIIRSTIRQLQTPDHLRGRVMSINMLFFFGGPELGEFEAGFLAAAIGAPASVIIGGVGTVVATLLTFKLVPRLRKYQGDEVLV